MRILITGDSFTYSYKNTWIERVCNELNLEMISCYGFRGQSQYKIYDNFIKTLVPHPDVIIVCHTEFTRLYNEGLADIEFAKTIQRLLVKDMQEQCKLRNIKMINIPCFEHDFLDKDYGLWVLAPGGLMICSKADDPTWDYKTNDKRLNHFSPRGHEIIANNIIPHIRNYINTDQQFHIASLYPEIFS
jgi:hypothetical protein